MTKPLEGIKVVEVAAWTFVPAAGAVLAEWGADVYKIENPQGGDPQRGLVSSGLVPGATAGFNFFIEQPNHGKRSVALNLQHPDGREALLKLCEDADVFLTSFLEGPRQRAGIDVEDIRAVNPAIIYVRGSGQGPKGPDAGRGGYDAASYFARSGILAALTPDGPESYGPNMTAAFGDLAGGQTIAGATAAAIVRRERTGETSVVDISLLNLGMWMNAPDIVVSKLIGQPMPKMNRQKMPNPIVNRYRTKDGRMIQLVMLQATRFWPELVTAIGRPDLVDDPRFSDPMSIATNTGAAIAILDEVFAERTYEDWKATLASIEGVWAPAQLGIELHDDPQSIANGYIAQVDMPDGNTYPLVANPAQFDEQPNELTRAPELGEHTDEVLRSLGYSDEQLIELKLRDAVL